MTPRPGSRARGYRSAGRSGNITNNNTTDAKWGHFKRPRWGQRKRPLRPRTGAGASDRDDRTRWVEEVIGVPNERAESLGPPGEVHRHEEADRTRGEAADLLA